MHRGPISPAAPARAAQPSPFPHSCGTTLESLDTVRGTVGYAFLPNWMIYGTGGYAGGELNAWDQLTGVSVSRFTSGWTAGAGLQVLVSSNVSFKAEYLHVDLRSSTLFDIVPGVPETVGFTGDIFRIGLNWQFNTYAAPPAAQPYYTSETTAGRRYIWCSVDLKEALENMRFLVFRHSRLAPPSVIARRGVPILRPPWPNDGFPGPGDPVTTGVAFEVSLSAGTHVVTGCPA